MFFNIYSVHHCQGVDAPGGKQYLIDSRSAATVARAIANREDSVTSAGLAELLRDNGGRFVRPINGALVGEDDIPLLGLEFGEVSVTIKITDTITGVRCWVTQRGTVATTTREVSVREIESALEKVA